MGARAMYNVTMDPHVKNILDATTPVIVAKIEEEYQRLGPTDILTDVISFFLLHGTVIVLKMAVNNTPTFMLLHPEYDEVSLNMEPTQKLTLTKFLPKTQKEERLVFGGDNFKVYEGSLADINYLELINFLGYSTQGIV